MCSSIGLQLQNCKINAIGTLNRINRFEYAR